MRIGIYLGQRATGDHGRIDFTHIYDDRALNGSESSAVNLARGLAEGIALVPAPGAYLAANLIRHHGAEILAQLVERLGGADLVLVNIAEGAKAAGIIDLRDGQAGGG